MIMVFADRWGGDALRCTVGALGARCYSCDAHTAFVFLLYRLCCPSHGNTVEYSLTGDTWR